MKSPCRPNSIGICSYGKVPSVECREGCTVLAIFQLWLVGIESDRKAIDMTDDGYSFYFD